MFDRDGGGDIDHREIGLLFRQLGYTPSDAEMRALVSEADNDDSGSIDFEEFCLLMPSFSLEPSWTVWSPRCPRLWEALHFSLEPWAALLYAPEALPSRTSPNRSPCSCRQPVSWSIVLCVASLTVLRLQSQVLRLQPMSSYTHLERQAATLCTQAATLCTQAATLCTQAATLCAPRLRRCAYPGCVSRGSHWCRSGCATSSPRQRRRRRRGRR